MVRRNLTSTRIGKTFAQKGGDQFQRNFDHSKKCQSSLKPGDVLEVEGTPALRCQKVFFIECLPWDAVKGNSEKVTQNSRGNEFEFLSVKYLEFLYRVYLCSYLKQTYIYICI